MRLFSYAALSVAGVLLAASPALARSLTAEAIEAATRYQVAMVDVAKSAGLDARRKREEGFAVQAVHLESLSDVAAQCAWESYSRILVFLKKNDLHQARRGFHRLSEPDLIAAWSKVSGASALTRRLFRSSRTRLAALAKALGT